MTSKLLPIDPDMDDFLRTFKGRCDERDMALRTGSESVYQGVQVRSTTLPPMRRVVQDAPRLKEDSHVPDCSAGCCLYPFANWQGDFGDPTTWTANYPNIDLPDSIHFPEYGDTLATRNVTVNPYDFDGYSYSGGGFAIQEVLDSFNPLWLLYGGPEPSFVRGDQRYAGPCLIGGMSIADFVDGSIATATSTVDSSGVVTAITVSGGGSGFTTPPTVLIFGLGTGATATAALSGDVVDSINVTNGGSGYGYTVGTTFHPCPPDVMVFMTNGDPWHVSPLDFFTKTYTVNAVDTITAVGNLCGYNYWQQTCRWSGDNTDGGMWLLKFNKFLSSGGMWATTDTPPGPGDGKGRISWELITSGTRRFKNYYLAYGDYRDNGSDPRGTYTLPDGTSPIDVT